MQRPGIAEFAASDTCLQGLHDAFGGIHADVRHEKTGLQLVEHVGIDLALAKQQIPDAGGNLVSRLGERAVEARPQAKAQRHSSHPPRFFFAHVST